MTFRDVKDWPLYQVSDSGVVINKFTGRILSRRHNQKGYPLVRLSSNGKIKSIAVHRIVAVSFIPNPNLGTQVNHIDGNKENSHVSNLEWCTQSENMIHAYSHGLKVQYKGQRHGRAKLKDVDVLEIRKLRDEGLTHAAIGRKFNVSKSNIEFIVKRETWKHI